VDHDTPLLIEDWTLTVTGVTGDDPKEEKWTYDVTGSLTGPDGSGKSDTLFTSKSGRVKIDPQSFFRGFSPVLSVGHTITWHTYLLGTDQYQPTSKPITTGDNAVLLAQGLTNGQHRLELCVDTRDASIPVVKALRVYHPTISETKQ